MDYYLSPNFLLWFECVCWNPLPKWYRSWSPEKCLGLESCTQDWNSCPYERTTESCRQSLSVVMWWDSTHPWEDAGTGIHPGRKGSWPSWDIESASALILFFSASQIMWSKPLFFSYLVQGILCGSRDRLRNLVFPWLYRDDNFPQFLQIEVRHPRVQ